MYNTTSQEKTCEKSVPSGGIKSHRSHVKKILTLVVIVIKALFITFPKLVPYIWQWRSYI